ncbi:hypothetical protein NE237_002097 [Protea cynaroides]|uniref:Uncharacterized protein n=1 Tax=Protea cynaroides TaxID=273540 RepID=A0A9Q0KUL2_9MAGN|nr:hypothetical protein NE237_002097 [Protea cynaroides]
MCLPQGVVAESISELSIGGMVSSSVVSSAGVIVGNLAGPAMSFAAGKPSGSEKTMFDLDCKSEIVEWLLQISSVVYDGRPTFMESRTAPVGDGLLSVTGHVEGFRVTDEPGEGFQDLRRLESRLREVLNRVYGPWRRHCKYLYGFLPRLIESHQRNDKVSAGDRALQSAKNQIRLSLSEGDLLSHVLEEESRWNAAQVGLMHSLIEDDDDTVALGFVDRWLQWGRDGSILTHESMVSVRTSSHVAAGGSPLSHVPTGGDRYSLIDEGPSNVKVELLTLKNDLISSSYTSSVGRYLFKNIMPRLTMVEDMYSTPLIALKIEHHSGVVYSYGPLYEWEVF